MAQLPANVESASAGQHDIEDGHFEIAAGRLNQSVLAVAAGLDGVAFAVQPLGKEKGEIALVFDQQNARAYDATSFSSSSVAMGAG